MTDEEGCSGAFFTYFPSLISLSDPHPIAQSISVVFQGPLHSRDHRDCVHSPTFLPSLFSTTLTPLAATILATSYPRTQLPSILILICPPHPPTLLSSTRPSCHTSTHPPLQRGTQCRGSGKARDYTRPPVSDLRGLRLRAPWPVKAESI